MKVYVAGPITHGVHDLNIRRAIDVGQALLDAGHTPFVPHLSTLWNTVYFNTHERWLKYDKEWLEVCDALIRIPGKSEGADMEVTWAKEWGIPVFHSVKEFLGTTHFQYEPLD